MVEIYDAHEQGEVVKKWLRENGSAIVMGLVIAFGGLFGFKQWQNWQENDRQQASTEFEVLDQLLTDGQLDAAMSNFQNLRDDHAGSPYTSMAALKMARARVEVDQPDLAIGLYEFVVESGSPRALSAVAREARYAEVRGDILYAQGRRDEAVAAYLEALSQREAGVGDRGKLVMKLQAMGAEIPPEDSES
jgi:predicted negative regulator of RcsB-dependent stress response